MRKIKNYVLTFCFIIALFAASLTITPANVQAAAAPRFVKSGILMRGQGKNNDFGYGIINSVKSDKILNLKSSNTSVLTVKKSKFIDDYTIMMKAKKQGTSTVSFTVKRKNGKIYRFKSKFTVYNYANPFSKCTIGKTNYKKQFDKNYMVNAKPSTKKEKITVTARKGYKITGIYYCEYGTGKEKKIKNGSTVKVDELHYVRVNYKNTAKKYSYAANLMGTI